MDSSSSSQKDIQLSEKTPLLRDNHQNQHTHSPHTQVTPSSNTLPKTSNINHAHPKSISAEESTENNNKQSLFTILTITSTIILFLFTSALYTYISSSSSQPKELFAGSDVNYFSVEYNSSLKTYQVLWNSFANPASSSSSSAYGTFYFNLDNNGWNYFDVEGHPSDHTSIAYLDSMKAMGFLEGFATYKQITQFYSNYYESMFGSEDVPLAAVKYLNDNYRWMKSQAFKHYKKDDNWLIVAGVINQLDGLLDGYRVGIFMSQCQYTNWEICLQAALNCIQENGACSTSSTTSSTGSNGLSNILTATITHFMILNSNGDLYQILQKIAQYDSQVADERKLETNNDDETQKMSSFGEFWADNKNRFNHCSALVKILFPKSAEAVPDVAIAHDTWDDFRNAGPRIFKHYLYNVSETNPYPAEMFFSSSPGLLSSVDDFYTFTTRGTFSTSGEGEGVVTPGGRFAVIETSLDVYTVSILGYIKPTTLLSWMRVRLANYLATDGTSWSQLFSFHHSGTYTNQWMVIDYSKLRDSVDENVDRFSVANWFESGFLTILEEMPGLIHYEDKTLHFLKETYWASYNNPYFDIIANYSGTKAACEEEKQILVQHEIFNINGSVEYTEGFNPLLATPDCLREVPRAKLFHRLQASISTLHDMKHTMSYNRFQNDFESGGDSCESISCRQDLEVNVTERRVFGAIDSKVATVRTSDPYRGWGTGVGGGGGRRSVSLTARQGPTTEDQPPFCWSKYIDETKIYPNMKRRFLRSLEASYGGIPPFWRRRGVRGHTYSHEGQPNCYNYTWVTFPPGDDVYVALPSSRL